MAKKAKDQARQIYLVHGEDEWTVSTTAKKLVQENTPAENPELGLEIINAQADTVAQALRSINECVEAVFTPGFLTSQKTVWLRNANFLDQSVIGKSKDVRIALDRLAKYIKNGIPVGHVLIISASDVNEKSDFFKACKEHGDILCFNLEKARQRETSAEAFVTESLRQMGVGADRNVVRALVLKAGTDHRQLWQEMEKLTIFLDNKRAATPQDVEAIVSPIRELFYWDLEDATADRNTVKALSVLRRLLFQKQSPIWMVESLENRFRCLLVLREALDQGWIKLSNKYMNMAHVTAEQEKLFYDALNDNRLRNPFIAGLRTQQAMHFSQQELLERRRLILETRQQLVSSSFPPALALELLVIKLCRK